MLLLTQRRQIVNMDHIVYLEATVSTGSRQGYNVVAYFTGDPRATVPKCRLACCDSEEDANELIDLIMDTYAQGERTIRLV